MKHKPPIYLFDPHVSYKTFYKVWSKFPVRGIVPVEFSKGTITWEMIRDKEIYVYIDSLREDDPICFGMKLPKGRRIILITNPKKSTKKIKLTKL